MQNYINCSARLPYVGISASLTLISETQAAPCAVLLPYLHATSRRRGRVTDYPSAGQSNDSGESQCERSRGLPRTCLCQTALVCAVPRPALPQVRQETSAMKRATIPCGWS